MKRFAALLETLILTPSRNRKIATLRDYFGRAGPRPGPGGGRDHPRFDPAPCQIGVAARPCRKPGRPGLVQPVLRLCRRPGRDSGFDLADSARRRLAPPGRFVAAVESLPKDQIADQVAAWLDIATPNERRAMIKLATGGLRVGVSARLAKTALATMATSRWPRSSIFGMA